MTSYLNRLNKLWIFSENKEFYSHVAWIFTLEILCAVKGEK